MIVTYFDLEPIMSTLLYVDFPYSGPWGEDMAIAMKELAQSISQEPGLIWKLWTENQEQSKAGGVYLFSDKASAQAYLDMHSKRLNSVGITGIDARFFDVNPALSEINAGPLSGN